MLHIEKIYILGSNHAVTLKEMHDVLSIHAGKDRFAMHLGYLLLRCPYCHGCIVDEGERKMLFEGQSCPNGVVHLNLCKKDEDETPYSNVSQSHQGICAV